METVNFVCENTIYTLNVQEDFLNLVCIEKNSNLPLSSFNKSIKLLDIVSTGCNEDKWQLDNDGKPKFKAELFKIRRPTLSSCFSLSINYCDYLKKHRRSLKTITLLTSKQKECQDWHEFLKTKVDDNVKKHNFIRPSHLLVILNPNAGNRKGETIYKDCILPLFQLAEVKVTLCKTQHTAHATELIVNSDLSGYDGIIAVGGDGTLSEVVNGVLLWQQKKHGILLDGGDTVFTKPISYAKATKKIGVIPVGTGNLISYTTQGISEPETATLQIICGESHPLDVCSVYDSKGNFAAFSVMGIGYGFISDVIKLSDSMRRLGSAKTVLAFMRGVLNLKSYHGEISYLESSPENPVALATEKTNCRFPCDICLGDNNDNKTSKLLTKCTPQELHGTDISPSIQECVVDSIQQPVATEVSTKKISEENIDEVKKDENQDSMSPPSVSSVKEKLSQWKVAHGHFAMISSMNTAGMFSKAPEGTSPSAHLADGTNDLLLVRGVSKMQFLSFLGSMAGSGNIFECPFVEAHRIQGMHFRVPSKNDPTAEKKREGSGEPSVSVQPNGESQSDTSSSSEQSCWNSDGEFLDINDNIVSLWVHKGLVTLFAKGIERN